MTSANYPAPLLTVHEMTPRSRCLVDTSKGPATTEDVETGGESYGDGDFQ